MKRNQRAGGTKQEEEKGLRPSSHLEKKNGIVYIVGNRSGRQRVATGDEVELHAALEVLSGSLREVLEELDRVGVTIGPAGARARGILGQIDENQDE